ncbi:MAG TPA: glycosyltransferase family 2 protein [Tepidisphaeraceae bacterium]|jgi:glycosyltransferase involved in cell wall biosynthesis|nr:glycosyltransferase family 2 protein [Tepidisphaeraceae bacterium]
MELTDPPKSALPTEATEVADVDVLIQTFNEEENLPHTLASLKGWVRRIFVVDSGSTDRTMAIAQEFGATVVNHPWEGYAAQKNWALDNLPFESNWILILDADESVSPKLREEIEGIVSRQSDRVHEAGFYLNRVFIFMGRQIRHCGYFPSWNLRLFKRGKARYEDRMVHEHMVVAGPTGYLQHLILHEDRRGLEHFFAKHNRYSTLEAREIFESPEPWPGVRQFMRDRVTRRRFVKSRILPYLPLPWTWRLIYMYIVRGGFLDGKAGWVLSNFISSYEFFIQTKYQELRRLRGRQAFTHSGLAEPEGQISFRDQTGVTHRFDGDTVEFNVTPPSTAKVVPEAPMPAVSTATVVANRLTTTPRRPATLAPVSVVIPTLNEAANLPRCLDHLQWADEVVVVDSGSTDETNKIAEAYGAKVIQFRWNGHWPKKKNWTLRHADLKHKWVLIVDADEWITPELAEEIQRAVTRDDKYVGHYINRRFIFMGQWIKHCGYYPSWNGRLIKRGYGEYEQLTGIGNTGSGDNEVHEHVIFKGPAGYLDHDMLHFAFPNIHTFMEKHNRYSNWEAAVQFKKADTSSAVIGNEQLTKRRKLKNVSRHLPFRPMLRFLYSYVYKGGFLDGPAGYVFCRLLSIYEYLSVAKYHELKRAEEDHRKARLLSAVPAINIQDLIAERVSSSTQTNRDPISTRTSQIEAEENSPETAVATAEPPTDGSGNGKHQDPSLP